MAITNSKSLSRRTLLSAFAYAPAAALLSRSVAWGQGALTLSVLSPRITLLAGGGGNIAIVHGADGPLLVDSGTKEAAEGVAAKVAEVSKTPVAHLLNTHWHYDHVGGDPTFGKAGAHIMMSEKTKARVVTKQHIAFLKIDSDPLPPEGRPAATFASGGSMTHAGEKIHYRQLEPAHTDSDTIVHFQNSNVLHTGDLFFNGMYPFIDYSSGGSIEGMIANSAAMAKMVDAKTQVIPGHGPMGTKADLLAYHDMLSTVNEKVSPLVKAGKSATELVAADPLADLNAKWGAGFLKPEQFLQMLHQGKTKA